MDFQSIALPTELWYLRCFASAKIQHFFYITTKKNFFLNKYLLFIHSQYICEKNKMDQLIAIDIGNTRSKYAIFEGKEIIASSTFNPYHSDLKQLISEYPNIKKGILSSVGGKVKECLDQLQGIETLTLTGHIPLPFKLGYDNKDTVGSDRLAAIAAVMESKEGQNSLIIDIGTCITYDILTSDNIHLKGPISPGIKLRFASMNEHTEKLPLCTATTNESKYICNTTEESLQSGVIIGIGNEIEGFINTYLNIFKEINVFIIGGDNIFFENRFKNCIFANSNFIFNGLRYILNYQ